MYGTFALIGTLLLSAPHVDKVNFTHSLKTGDKASYDLDVKGDTPQGELQIKALFDTLVGEKAEKGMNVTVTPTKVEMVMAGNAMDQTGDASPVKLVIDEFGLPDTVNMAGNSSFMTLAFLLSYLPNKELEVGDSFNVDWKTGDVTYKGSGKFDGTETVDGKQLQKLSMKTTLHPGDQQEGELVYTVFYDPEKVSIPMVKGTATVQSQEFNFTLTKK